MQTKKIKVTILDPSDNVGIALNDLKKGEVFNLNENMPLKLEEPIPYMHKFSTIYISQYSKITKKGQIIGEAIEEIHPGYHVHIHNMRGLRGRQITDD